jgi:Dyp-type peroxidase family
VIVAPELRTEMLNRGDMQGLILRAYSELPFASYYLLEIVDPILFKLWLAERLIANDVTTSEDRPGQRDHALNLAFTYLGLNRLGVRTKPLPVPNSGGLTYDGFGLEFKEGLVVPERSRFLGDMEENDPWHWSWGGTNPSSRASSDRIHCLCLLYGTDPDAVATTWERLRPDDDTAPSVYHRDVYLPEDGREHFGFADGISQPTIRFTKRDYDTTLPADRALHVVEAGEFILGYENENLRMPVSPAVVDDGSARSQLLPPLDGSSVFRESPFDSLRDFGRNGTYLVLRQLHQNVARFRRFLITTAGLDPAHQDWLAARMVGRWPSGAPVTRFPDADPWTNTAPTEPELNGFRYDAEDRHGYRCPIGAHIRRGNPRDSTAAVDRELHALERVNSHRLLRRGRLYGERIGPEYQHLASDDDERGLMFLCLNADLRRQFEFVQQTWVNSHKFGGLLDEPDPLVGPAGDFTVQGAEGHRRVSGLPRFIQVTGGAYFFMPGMRALQYLAR